MRNSIVTIIIPVYNVECYLDRCLESVTNQTYSDLEIILVDDCSPDGSPRLCDKWAARDKRIRVIHKKLNEGAGMARNSGLEGANGKYILFVDADDYIALETVEKSVHEAEKKCVQAVVFGHHEVNQEGKIVGSYITQAEQNLFVGAQVQELLLPAMLARDPSKKEAEQPSHARAVLLESKLLKEKQWHFASERQVVSEDVYALLDLYQHICRASLLAEYLYYYCENSVSLTRSYKPDYYENVKVFYTKMTNLCDQYGYDKAIRHKVVMNCVAYTTVAIKQVAKYACSTSRQIKEIKRIVNDEMTQYWLQEVKSDRYKLSRKILYFAIRHRLSSLCWILAKLKG